MEEECAKGEEQTTSRPLMAESPTGESIPAAINSKPDDSNRMMQSNRSASPSSSKKNTGSNGNKAKSCKGCLYYSSRLKADSRNPVCVGLTRSLPSVPHYIVGQSEMEASKEGRSLADFRYACVGYSLYTDRKEPSSDGQPTQTELPVCVGLEVLATGPAHVHNKDDVNALPQRQSPPKPSSSTGDEFFSRFTRNANLVANGVAKNVRRVGNQIKQSLDDILYPYRKRPK